MIRINNKEQCCGCAACMNICPRSAISMNIDEEGFLYPEVLLEQCSHCGLCENVCPMLEKAHRGIGGSVHLGIQYKDQIKRMESTAGGGFSLIADAILNQNGIVYAVDYDNMIVVHKAAYQSTELQGMRGSKYVQSKVGEIYSEIRLLLKENKIVLFVGTPCQVQGLIKCVGNVENLYTMDLLCLGVSSPKLFEKWVQWLTKKHGNAVSRIYFRNKKFGYATTNVRVVFENGKILEQKYDSKCYPNTFFKAYNVRPSCYKCEFRECPRVSDFTVGDFVQIGDYSKNMDDDKGTTSLWIHSEKGRALYESLSCNAEAVVIEKNCTNIIGGPSVQMKKPQNRKDFFDDAENLDFEVFINKWVPKNIKSEFASIVRIVVNKIPFKTVLFKMIRTYKGRKFHKQVEEANKNGE